MIDQQLLPLDSMPDASLNPLYIYISPENGHIFSSGDNQKNPPNIFPKISSTNISHFQWEKPSFQEVNVFEGANSMQIAQFLGVWPEFYVPFPRVASDLAAVPEFSGDVA